MPIYFFEVFNRIGLARGSEGKELPDRDVAQAEALDSIRSIVAEDVRQGLIDLSGRIDVRDEAGETFAVRFEDSFKLATGASPAEGAEAQASS